MNNIAKFLKDVFISPVTKTVGKTALGGEKLTGGILSALTGDPRYSQTSDYSYGGLGLTPQESRAVEADPWGQGVGKGFATAAQTGAEAALLPFKAVGAGAKALRLGASAGAGALGGYGMSEPGAEAGGTALGGLLGIAGGAIREVTSKPAQDLTNKLAKQTLLQGVSHEKSKVLKGVTPAKLDKGADTLIDEFKKVTGQQIFGKEDLANNLDKVKRSLSANVDRVGQSETVNKQSIVNLVAKTFDDNVDTFEQMQKSDAWRKFTNTLNSLDDNITGADARKLLNMVDDIGGGFAKINTKDVSTDNITSAITNIRKGLRSVIAKESPQMSKELTKFSQAINVADQFTKGYSGKVKVGTPLVSGLQLDVRDLATKVTSGLTRVLQGAEKGAEAFGRTMEATAPYVGSALGNMLNVQPGELQQGQGMQMDQEVGQDAVSQLLSQQGFAPQYGAKGELLGYGQAQQPKSQQDLFLDDLSMAVQLLPNASYREQLAMAQSFGEMRGTTGGVGTIGDIARTGAQVKLTEGDKDYIQARTQAQSALDYLLTTGGAGKAAQFAGDIGAFFGSPSSAGEYRTRLNSAVSSIKKALIGAGQTEAELKNLDLPKATDEPAVAKVKIENLIKFIDSRPISK